jgi:hypothetical protein
MHSPIVVITAIESGFGFLLASTILCLILLRGRKAYHYLFAAFLLICAIWDLGVFLLMIRNGHPEELRTIGYVIGTPCTAIPALIFHFACLYTGRPVKWAIALAWGVTVVFWALGFAGLYWKIDGVHTYSWGNMFRVAPSVAGNLYLIFWFALTWPACWLLFTAARRADSRMAKRHYLYVAWGVLVISLAIVKVGVVMGVNLPFILPLGMFLVDIFNAIIGVAIVKERLFDITVLVKKGAVYSLLAALLIFIYSLCEHLLVTYVGELVGDRWGLLQFISVALGIAVLLPVKGRVERAMEGWFRQKKVEF